MTGGMKVMILGIVICIIAVIMCIASLMVVVKDPSVEARATVTYAPSDYEMTAHLQNGVYEIWYLVTSDYDIGPGGITVEDSSGHIVFMTPVSYVTESITIDNKKYKKVGSFTLSDTGSYNVTVDNSDCTLYFTPPIGIMSGLAICFGGVGIGILGGVLILVGFILHLGQKKKATPHYPPQYPQQYPPERYPPQYPPQQGPPMPPSI